jgi:hypothetical protein
MYEQFRLSKRFPIYERLNFQIGMNMTNPFNRTDRYISSTSVGDSQFGALLQGGGGKVVQIDGRFEW